MSRDVGVSELLALLQSSDLKELEQVKSTISEQLNTDRGTVVLSSLLEFYLDSSSSEAALLLSSIREPLDKPLLEKLNDCLVKSVNRLASLTLLGHVVRRQPPWIHKISRSPLLPSLLRCLKGDSDVVVLVTGVLVLVALLPMIPQAGKRHIYDFFDVFGRLASWSHKNPSAVHEAYLVHLHASVYSLFHRLYGMFPCNFISYLRLHYSMKENLDVFHNIVKPMLEHVRVHPELVTGAQDSELDPSRWKCYEVHDIVIECAKVSLDPREEGCPQLADKWSCLRPDHLSLPPTPLTPQTPLAQRLSGSSTSTPMSLSLMDGHSPIIQQWDSNDVIWSPSIECKLATPPASRGLSPANVSDTTLSPTQPLNRTTSISGLRYPASANVSPSPTMTLEHQQQKKQQPMAELESSASQQMKVKGKERQETNNNSGKSMSLNELSSFITETQGETESHKERDDESITEELSKLSSPEPSLLQDSVSMCSLGSLGESSVDLPQHSPPASSQQSFSLPSQFLFELAQPTPAQEMKRSSGKEEASALGASVEEGSSLSPLELLDRLITQGYQAHQNLRMPNKALDWSYFGGKQQSMKTKGSAQGDELQMLRSQLLLVHGQLQYERYKRQQHAVRNRRLLREVIKSTTLEEHSTSMQAQLSLQEGEIQALRASLAEEQRRFYCLHDDSKTNTGKLQSQMEQQQQQLLDSNSTTQKLRIELQECRGRLGDLEAELQKANNEAYNAEHQLTQLSLKVSSSEELQQQMFLMNKHLVLLRETNRLLIEQRDNTSCQDTSRLRGRAEKELEEANKRLKELELANKKLSELETANQRLAEMEALLGRKEQMILDLKKLLEDTKIQARVELGACESRYVAVKRISQALNNELLELYSLLDPPAQTAARRNGGRGSIPITQDNRCLGAKPSSSLSILNGGVELLSTSPLSLSPIESPLDVGSFLGQRARMLFRPPGNSPEEGAELGEGAEPLESPDHDGECLEEEEQGEEARDLHHQHSSSQLTPPPPPQQGSLLQDASSSILGIMDYDGMLLEY